MDASTLAVITVTYHPDLAVLRAQIESLPEAALKVMADNASPADLREALEELCATRPHSVFIANDTNLGLPAAISASSRAALGVIGPSQQTLPGSADIPANVRHATSILTHLGRAYGPHPLVFDEPISQRTQELTIYLRQSHAERDLAALGELVRLSA